MNTVPLGRSPTLYVINLAASATPVTLIQPQDPELRGYTFFVSRRREEGRDRFRLHMGYFHDPAHAEDLLPTIREIYPTAWVGPATEGSAPAPAGPVAAPVPGESADALLGELRDLQDLLASLGDAAEPEAGPAGTPAPGPARTLEDHEVLRLLDDTAPTVPAPLRSPLPKAGVVQLGRPGTGDEPSRTQARRRPRKGPDSVDPGRQLPAGALLETLGAGEISLDDGRDPAGLAGLRAPRTAPALEAAQQRARFGRLLGALSARFGQRRQG